MFKKAERKKAKLRLALSGPSGSGKTMGALKIAKGIGGKVAVLDTERGSASLYADMLDFDVVELGPPYTPENFIEVIHAAEKAGYDILIIDSITHEWKGQGGILEIVDNTARAKFNGNSYAAWSVGNARHQKFIDSILHSSLHIIVTMRSKAVYVEVEKNGSKKMQKQGTAPEQRDGMEYEFTALLELNIDGNLAVKSKDRTRLFNDPIVITEDTGIKLREWLESGAEAAPEPKPEPRPTPAPNPTQPQPQTITDPIAHLADLYAGDEEEVMMDDINERLRAAAERQNKPFEPVDTLRDLSKPLATWLIGNIKAQPRRAA